MDSGRLGDTEVTTSLRWSALCFPKDPRVGTKDGNLPRERAESLRRRRSTRIQHNLGFNRYREPVEINNRAKEFEHSGRMLEPSGATKKVSGKDAATQKK